MSINKQALLEWLNKHLVGKRELMMQSVGSERDQADGFILAVRTVIDAIQSGRFDAPEMEHINAYWAREGLIKHQQEEIQRLRAELADLIEIAKKVNEQSVCMKLVLAEKIKRAEEALSTTTERSESK